MKLFSGGGGATTTTTTWTSEELVSEVPKSFDDADEEYMRRFLRQAHFLAAVSSSGGDDEWDRSNLVRLCDAQRAAWEVRRVLACFEDDVAGHAAVLRVSPDRRGRYPEHEVKASFRALSKVVHPDKNGAEGASEAMTRVNEAKEALLLGSGGG